MPRSTRNSNAGHRAQKLKASKGAVPYGRSTRSTTRNASANVKSSSKPKIIEDDESVKTSYEGSAAETSPSASSPSESSMFGGSVKGTSGKDDAVKDNSTESTNFKGFDTSSEGFVNNYNERDLADKGDAAATNKTEQDFTKEVCGNGSFTSACSQDSADAFDSQRSFETDVTETSFIDNFESAENKSFETSSKNPVKSEEVASEKQLPEDKAKDPAETEEAESNYDIPEDILNTPLDNSSDEEDLDSEFESDPEDDDITSDCSDSDEGEYDIDEDDLTIRDDDFVLTFTTAHLAGGFKVSASSAVPPPFVPGSAPQLAPAKKYKLSKLTDFRSHPLKLESTPLIPFEALFSEEEYSHYILEDFQEQFLLCLFNLRLSITQETVVFTDPTIPNDPDGFYAHIASFYGAHSGQCLPHDHPLARICPHVTTDGSWYKAATWRWKPREIRALDWLRHSFPQTSVFELPEQRNLYESASSARQSSEAGPPQCPDPLQPDEIEEFDADGNAGKADEDIEEITIDDPSLQHGWERLQGDGDTRKRSEENGGKVVITFTETSTVPQNPRKRTRQKCDNDTDEEYNPERFRTKRKRSRRERTPSPEPGDDDEEDEEPLAEYVQRMGKKLEKKMARKPGTRVTGFHVHEFDSRLDGKKGKRERTRVEYTQIEIDPSVEESKGKKRGVDEVDEKEEKEVRKKRK